MANRKRTHKEDINLGKRRALKEIEELVGKDTDLFKEIKKQVDPPPKRKRKRKDLIGPSVDIHGEVNTQRAASKYAVVIQGVLRSPRNNKWYRIRGSQHLSSKGRLRLLHAIQERMRYFKYTAPEISFHQAFDGVCFKWSLPPTLEEIADYSYLYQWKNTDKRAKMFGRKCKRVKAIDEFTVEIAFEDNGEVQTVSKKALRRVKG